MQLTKEFYRPGMLQHHRTLKNHHHQLQQHRQREASRCRCQQREEVVPALTQAAAPLGLKQAFLQARVRGKHQTVHL
jgi:hypothetical protein